MDDPQYMDLHTLPLAGSQLIEASAGTGKTYTIANLVLRLIVEEALDVRHILVVTFTDAATQELRDRIRQILGQAYAVCCSDAGETISEPLDLLSRAVGISGRKKVTALLKKAIIDFDEASIFTIHGFLNRLLRDNAFESAMMFDTELVSDQQQVIQGIIDDFFRLNVSAAPAISFALLLNSGLNGDALFRYAHVLLAMPLARITPPDPGVTAEAVVHAFSSLKAMWMEEKEEIQSLLLSSSALKRNEKTYREDKVAEYIADVNALCNEIPHPDHMKGLSMFSQVTIDGSVKAKKTAPSHPFFDQCRTFFQCANRFLLSMKHEFSRYLFRELKQRKASMNIQSFDDLLLNVWEALDSGKGKALCQSVGDTYHAVLIDEFQDTDTLQYRIFMKLFDRPDACLFFIGDPKQSIYAFRGADIFSYMDAADKVADEKKHTLAFNWRSASALVEAVNDVFGSMENPFLLGSHIPFHRVRASQTSKGNTTPLLLDDTQGDALVLSILPEGQGKKSPFLSKTDARDLALCDVVAEIVRLLDLSSKGRAVLGDRPLLPSDMAVLVTRNDDATLLKDLLAEADVPSVVTKTGSVFQSREAGEMERLLVAIASPGDTAKINGVLTCTMIGCSGREMWAFMESPDGADAYQEHMERFYNFHDQWRDHGFLTMFRLFMAAYGVRQTLLSFPDGERRLTNMFHLAELLHLAELEMKLGINGLLTWLCDNREQDTGSVLQELRLERDDMAVQILTVFKSKGLQYPIVFCPCMWQQGAILQARSDAPLVHHDHGEVCINVGGKDDRDLVRYMAEKERLSELLRLLYVAVTRAQNRCYLTAGYVGRFSLTALDYLFSGGVDQACFTMDAVVEKAGQRDYASLMETLTRLAGKSSGHIDIRQCGVPEMVPAQFSHGEKEEKNLSARTRQRISKDRFRITSYSALASGTQASSSLPASNLLKQDETNEPVLGDPAKDLKGFFSFPRGATPGTCVHAVFEQIDFTEYKDSPVRETISACLSKYGLSGDTGEENRGEAVYQMIRHVMETPLLADDPHFFLKDVPPEHRLNEMEFFYPLNEDAVSILADAYPSFATVKNTPEKALVLKSIHGYMHGFIDCVFYHKGKYYILDWKTNHLGNAYRDYDSPSLVKHMGASMYDLQYHIYTTALHLYLKNRISDYAYPRDFGGVFYLFVRGIHSHYPGNGIFFDRPEQELIEQMSRMCEL